MHLGSKIIIISLIICLLSSSVVLIADSDDVSSEADNTEWKQTPDQSYQYTYTTTTTNKNGKVVGYMDTYSIKQTAGIKQYTYTLEQASRINRITLPDDYPSDFPVILDDSDSGSAAAKYKDKLSKLNISYPGRDLYLLGSGWSYPEKKNTALPSEKIASKIIYSSNQTTIDIPNQDIEIYLYQSDSITLKNMKGSNITIHDGDSGPLSDDWFKLDSDAEEIIGDNQGILSSLGEQYYQSLNVTSRVIQALLNWHSTNYTNSDGTMGYWGLLSRINVTDAGETKFISVNNKAYYIGPRDASMQIGAGLDSLQFPEGTIGLYQGAFHDCTGLTYVKLPSSITYVGQSAFRNCTNLTGFDASDCTSLIMDGGVTAVAGTFYGSTTDSTGTVSEMMDKLKVVKLPFLTNIPKNLFGKDLDLTTFEIADSTLDGSIQFGLDIRSMSTFGTSLSSFKIPIDKVSQESLGALVSLIAGLKSGTTLILCHNGSEAPVSESFVVDAGSEKYAILFDVQGALTIPDGATKILSGQLSGNKKVTSVIFPDSVTVVGKNSFFSCTALTSVSFGSGLTDIEMNAFNGCGNLTTIAFANDSKLKTIGSNAFASCTSLTELVLPSSLDSIDSNAFYYCNSLAKIVLNSSNGLTIGDSAFEGGAGKSSLQTVTFNTTGNIVIGNNSFKVSSVIDNLILPEGLSKLGTKAFGTLGGISIPASLSTVNMESSRSSSFSLTDIASITVASGCTTFSLDGDALYYCGSGDKVKLVWAKSDITSLVIPDTVKSIMDGGILKGKESLISVTIGSGITSLNTMEFLRCYSLETVTFSDSSVLTAIPARAFSGTALKSIAIPDSVSEIGASAFYDCAALATVSTSSSSLLKNIGPAAFYACQSLNSVTLPAGLQTFGDTDKNDPDTGKTIRGNVFWSDTKLSTITFTGTGDLSCSNGMILKGDKLFYVLPAVSSITIPDNVTECRTGSFEDSNLSSIQVSGSNTKYFTNQENTVLADKDTKAIVYIPSMVRSITIKAEDAIVSLATTNVWAESSSDTIEFSKRYLTESYITKNASSLQSIIWESNNDVSVSGFYGSVTSVAFNITGKLTLGSTNASLKILEINAESMICDDYLVGNGSCIVTINLKESTSDNIVGSDGIVKQIFTPVIRELNINNLHGGLTRYFSDGRGYDKSLTINRDGVKVDTLSTLLGISIETTSNDFIPTVVEVYKANSAEKSYVLVDMLNDLGYANKNLDVNMSGSDSVGSVIDEYICLIPSTINDNHVMTFTVTLKNNVEKKSVTMDFRVSGVSNPIYQVILGNSLTASQLSSSNVTNTGYTFDGWYVDNKLSRPYTGSAISDDMTLYAKWSLNEGLTVTILGGDYIESTYKTDGIIFYSGDKVVSGTKLQFTPISNEFEVLGWTVNGFEKTGRTLEVEVTSDTTVVPNMRYSSASNILTTISTIDAPYEDIVEVWSKSFEVDTSMQTWTGFPSTPLVVDNTIYVRAADTLYKISSSDGSILKSKKVDNTTAVAFYHYLGYGGGYIIDYMTQKAYDLDFENEKSMPLKFSAVFYDDGCYYGLNNGKLYKMDSQFQLVTTGGWNGGVEVSWHAIYGSTSAPLFINGHIYFIEITGTDREQRSISAIDVSSGTKITQRLSELDNKLIDDGWLSSYDYEGSTYLFLTAYTSGLFEGDSGGGSKVGCVKLKSDGTFDKFDDSTEAIFMNLKNGSLASGLIVVDGRGYINVTGTKETGAAVLYVVDVNEFIKTKGNKEIPIGGDSEKTTKTNAYVIYATESFANHGNIVVNTSQYRTGGSVYIYELAYDSGKQALYVFEDHAGKTEATSYYKTKTIGSNYCSQAVRLDVNGGFVWYTDSGTLYYAASIDYNVYTFFLDNGDNAVSYRSAGEDAYDALTRAMDENDIQFSYSVFTKIVSIGGKKSTDENPWNAWALVNDEWKVINLLSDDEASAHTYVLYCGANIDSTKNWVYTDSSNVAHGYKIGAEIPDNAIGQQMSSLALTVNNLTISGNRASAIIIIINEQLSDATKISVYTEFKDETFMKTTSSLKFIDDYASLDVSMSGPAVPITMMIVLYDASGENQLAQKQVILQTS